MTEQEGPASNRRKTVKLGRKFAGSLATRLDAHPQSADTERIEDENRILSLMKDVLMLDEPDPVAVNFITHAVEVHTASFGFSKVIYEELFHLHQTRLKRPPKEEPEQRPMMRPTTKPPSAKQVPPPKQLVPPTPRAPANASPDSWKLRRSLKA